MAQRCRPSDRLRKWFGHYPEKWIDFKKKYREELKKKKLLLNKIKEIEKEKTTITLVYAARDEERNNAIILNEVLS